ncbi:cell division protein FtsL [Sedimentibacter sp. zth1]|uniref:cell division protein FtsL n=1 Tax=Sedimentibacter sp. zth1 TaxID=2816908 RepID=UPI001A9239DC|nr:cell division protein FtsL [Sedimentibacter sp. zth1]QSX06146.1 cell division protein FtsL [Sedimentibacter sp. zth1]
MSALTKRKYNYDYEDDNNFQPVKKKRVIKKKKNNKITLGVVKNWMLVFVMFGLGITIVYNYATITEKKMDIKNFENEILTLNNEIDQYNISLESLLNNTNKIENMAKSYLGMNYPTRKQTVFLDVTYDDTNSSTQSNSKDETLGFLERVFRLFR